MRRAHAEAVQLYHDNRMRRGQVTIAGAESAFPRSLHSRGAHILWLQEHLATHHQHQHEQQQQQQPEPPPPPTAPPEPAKPSDKERLKAIKIAASALASTANLGPELVNKARELKADVSLEQVAPPGDKQRKRVDALERRLRALKRQAQP